MKHQCTKNSAYPHLCISHLHLGNTYIDFCVSTIVYIYVHFCCPMHKSDKLKFSEFDFFGSIGYSENDAPPYVQYYKSKFTYVF